MADDKNLSLIAIDTEWYDAESPEGQKIETALSTIQLAYADNVSELSSQDDPNLIHTFVVDLTVQQPEYMQKARELIRWILYTNNLVVLGFAVGHDVHMLRDFVTEQLLPTTLQASQSPILDLQLISACGNFSTLPGLKASAARFSEIPLSKTEQVSSWSDRPLRQTQLDYAGLDAAILLVLLSEEFRRLEKQEIDTFFEMDTFFDDIDGQSKVDTREN